MPKLSTNTRIDHLSFESIQGESVSIPHQIKLTHLQFRRFAGCPMCNLHIQSFIKNHPQLLEAGIQEVAVFHSSKSSLLAHHANGPFPFIADPQKQLYRKFGVEASIMALLHPRAWLAGIEGLLNRRAGLPTWGESVTGLPADFLINQQGNVIACKYGTHAYDHWELDEVLQLAKRFAV